MFKMKKRIYIPVIIVTIYVLGFFLATAIRILSTETQSQFLMNTSYKINYILYESWVFKLENNNLIKKTYAKNSIFWCNHFESCTVFLNK